MSRTTYVLLLAVFMLGCSSSKKSSEETETQNTKDSSSEKSSALTLTKAPESPQYPDAGLIKRDLSQTDNDTLVDVNYQFTVENFELGAQTEGADTRGIANSGKGQHIHFIVNNGPYAAHYMSDISSGLEWGDYVVLAFLSRSYHESVKSEGAWHLEKMTVGNPYEAGLEVDLDAPHLFYSRPKGTYSGKDTEKVMLDFYLVNCDLSPEGFNVKATINGEEFMIDEWAPFYMTGLPMGETTIQLELLDSGGNLVDSPYNPVVRTVTLTE